MRCQKEGKKIIKVHFFGDFTLVFRKSVKIPFRKNLKKRNIVKNSVLLREQRLSFKNNVKVPLFSADLANFKNNVYFPFFFGNFTVVSMRI